METIQQLQNEGWDIVEESDTQTRLVKKSYGSWKAHAVLLPFTMGLGNLYYAARKRTHPSEKIIVDSEYEEGDPIVCSRCDEEHNYVAKKCQECGYKGVRNRTDRLQMGIGASLLGCLILPLLPVGLWWILTHESAPVLGEAPFKNMSRDEWRELSE